MRLQAYSLAAACILLSTSGCSTQPQTRPTLVGIDYIPEVALPPISIGYVPPFPRAVAADQGRAFAQGGAAYNACILELLSIKEQDEQRRANAQRD